MRISFQDLFQQCKTVKEEANVAEDELSTVTRQIAALLQTQFGASTRWSFDCSDPLQEMHEKNAIPIRINGDKGRALYRFGMISKVEKLPKEFKEGEDTSFYFAHVASDYYAEHKKEIAKVAEVAKAKNFESFVITPEIAVEALDPLCSVLVSAGGFTGARIRRKTHILVALKAEAMCEKKRSARDIKRAENFKQKPEKILKSMACDYLASNFSEIMEISENARASGKTFFRLKPKIDAAALPFIVTELKSRGYKKVNRDKKSILVRLIDTSIDDDFDDVEPDRD